MRTLQRSVIVAVFMFASISSAQTVNWRAEIGADMVQIIDGKMVYEDYEICGVEGGDSRVQIRYYAEAPVDAGISRDFFISQTVALDALIVYGVFAEASGMGFSAFMDVFECDPISAPIGTPDMELNVYMTGEGIQLEMVESTTATRERTSMTWAEVYAD